MVAVVVGRRPGSGRPTRADVGGRAWRDLAGNGGYRRLWIARTISGWGEVFALVAFPLLVFDRTGTGVGVTTVVAAEVVPLLLFAPLAGRVVDRHGPIRVMVAADLLRATVMAAVCVLGQPIGVIYAAAFGLSAGSALFGPAAGVLLPSPVTTGRLVAATVASGPRWYSLRRSSPPSRR